MAGSAQAGSGRSPRARGGASSSPACVSRSTFIPPRARGGSRSTERRTLSRVPACAGRGACPTASRLARSARSRARGAGRRRKGRGAPLQVHPRASGAPNACWPSLASELDYPRAAAERRVMRPAAGLGQCSTLCDRGTRRSYRRVFLVQPRPCGETADQRQAARGEGGRSPCGRGNRGFRPACAEQGRSSPVRAGSRVDTSSGRALRSADSRARAPGGS